MELEFGECTFDKAQGFNSDIQAWRVCNVTAMHDSSDDQKEKTFY